MSISLYRASVPVLIRGLRTMQGYLGQASDFARARNIAEAVLVNARLAPDMLPLAGQVQRASDSAKGAIGRLTALAVPSYADTETTLADLADRLARTIEFLQSVDAAQVDGSEVKKIELRFRTVNADLSPEDFVLQFLLPNVFFHVATAHDILRHNGVDIGKKDYLGDFN